MRHRRARCSPASGMVGVGVHDQRHARFQHGCRRLRGCAAWNRRIGPCRGRAHASICWWCIRRARICGNTRSRVFGHVAAAARAGPHRGDAASALRRRTAKARRCASLALPTTNVRKSGRNNLPPPAVSSVVTRSPAAMRRSEGGVMPKQSLPPEPMIMKLSGQPLRRRCASISATISYCRRPSRHARKNST